MSFHYRGKALPLRYLVPGLGDPRRRLVWAKASALPAIGWFGLGVPPVEPSELARVATRLSKELDEVNEFVSNIRARSHTDLLALRALVPTRLGVVASAVARRVELRFPKLTIDLQSPAAGASRRRFR